MVISMNIMEKEGQKALTKKCSSIWFTVLVTIIFFLLFGVVSVLTNIIFSEDIMQFQREGYCWANAAAQLFLSVMIMFIMQKIGIFDKQEYECRRIGRGLFIGLVGMIYALCQFVLNLIANSAYVRIPDLSYFMSNIFAAFTTGLFEETLVRGFTYNNFKRHFGSFAEGVKKSILCSSVLFGTIHIINLGGFDLASVLTVLSQVIYAGIIGMFFALVYVQSKSMWTVIIIHALIDGATFVFHSILTTEAFVAVGGETYGVGQIVLTSFVLPLAVMLPFVIAVIMKWKKYFSEDTNF